MGFTTGLLGGFTLTTTLLYISLSLHTRNRVQQATSLRQQSLVLMNIVEPQPLLPPPKGREIQAGMVETAKDMWNAELENNVRKVQQVDWDSVRQNVENGASNIWRRIKESGESATK